MVRIVRPWVFPAPEPFAAMVVLPDTILVRRGVDVTPHLLAHELVHCNQVRRLGLVRYWVTYLWQWSRVGYRDMPLEAEARRRARTHAFLSRARELVDEMNGSRD